MTSCRAGRDPPGRLCLRGRDVLVDALSVRVPAEGRGISREQVPDISVNMLKDKWKSVKDAFMHHRRKEREYRSGSAASAPSRYIHAEQLSFLIPCVEMRSTDRSWEPTVRQEEDEEEDSATQGTEPTPTKPYTTTNPVCPTSPGTCTQTYKSQAPRSPAPSGIARRSRSDGKAYLQGRAWSGRSRFLTGPGFYQNYGQHTTSDPDIGRSVDAKLLVTFVSSQNSGLLFLATGTSQYLLLELTNGTLRTRLERGEGESILYSPTWMVLKNRETYQVNLIISESQLSLTLNNFTSILDLPWSSQKLNFDRSIFLGGTGTSNIPYHLQTIPTFYGCILEARFDNIDLLSSSYPQAELHGQWEDCPINSLSNLAESFGFLGPRSYIIFPNWDMKSKGSISLTLETSRPGRAPLIYQSGPQKSYLYFEIAGGHLQGTLYTGRSVVKIQNMVYVSDSQPHDIHVFIDKSKMQLIVDTTTSQVSLDNLGQKLDLQGNLYLGGIDEISLAKIREGPLGRLFIDDMEYRSFSGCVTDLKINSMNKRLYDALVRRDITNGCHEYDDYAEYEVTTPSFSPATSAVSTVISNIFDICKMESSSTKLTSLLNPKPLLVTRGGFSILEWRHFHPTIDLRKSGLRQSQFLFSIVNDTQKGHWELDIPGAESRRKFTLLDVANHRVKYVHDGSQSHEDHLILEVSLASSVNIPECLKKAQRYNLTINISPSTAIPAIEFPKGNILGILKGGRKVLTGDIKINDPDTPCDLLKIYIMGNSKEGHVEFQHKPGKAIQEFSCKDLEEGRVVFIHKSGQEAQLTLQATDGATRSSLAYARFIVLDPQKNLTSKAVVVSEGSSVLITPSNLPVLANSDKMGIETMYNLVENPKLGVIQKLVAGEEWKATDTFKQSDLEKAGVRYLSTVSDIMGDEMSENLNIQLRLGSQLMSNQTLQVKVKRSGIKMMRMIPLKLGKTREIILSHKHLQVDTIMQGHELALFTYLIVQSPKKGNLQFDGRRLIEGSRFSQEDLVKERISYIATVRNTKDTEDQFQFQVLYHGKASTVYTYKFLIGADPDAPLLINQILHVLEGGQEAITSDQLFLKSGSFVDFVYEVIDGPQHGTLIRKGSPQSGDPIEEGISEFTNDDILDGLIFYQHDGSETTEDDIPFVASRQPDGSASDTSGEEEYEDQEVVRGVFRMSIQPVNDNPPLQIVQKVFTVVRDGQKLLTTNDIAFLDPDSGSTDAQIVLVRYGVPFGRIVFVDNPSLVVVRFTQEDLRRHRILFIHSGPDQGSIQLRVSDGLHHLTTILEVQASEPYILISNITTLNVLPGGKETLSATNFKLETNLDLRTEDEIKYYISTKPRWGEVLKGGQPTDYFSQQDLADGLVAYQHSKEGSNRDHFRISVEANQVVAVGDIKVQVLTDSPPVTLNVIHNEKVYVFQGESAKINKEYLMVSADSEFPHKIAYSLTDPPSFGYLVSSSGEPSSDGSPSLDSVQTFTQEDINNGKILYLHSASEMIPDRMTLEVSAGDTTEEIVVLLEILPIYIPVEASDLMVKEGGKTVLSSSILQIHSDYYLSLHLEFLVLDEPVNGRITNAEGRDLKNFSWNQFNQGQVLYEHNGSETKNDSFTIIVNAADVNRQSQSITINVTVKSVNDEKPRLITNTGMQILEGNTDIIPPQVLQSIDDDSSPEELIYSFLPPSNGEVIVRGFPGTLSSFSQKDLEQGMVQFMHKGELDGGFFFKVSDGENESEQHFFHIQATRITIQMQTMHNLIVCPRSLQQITSQHLNAVTNDGKSTSFDLVYHIENAPQIGQIRHQGNLEGPAVTNFTQAEIDEGLIYYQHVISPSPFWITQDNFSFHVQSPQAISQNYIFNVTVTFKDPCPQLHTQLWKNTGFDIVQGGSSPITSNSLDASNLLANPNTSRLTHDVVFFVTNFPSEGHLSLHGAVLSPETPYFLQSHLENGTLLYTNTKANSLHDSFKFKAQLHPKSESYNELNQTETIWIVTESFNITFTSLPLLPDIHSPKSKLYLAVGSNVSLTPDYISVDNALVSSDKIIYSIVEAPLGISVARGGNQSMTLSKFTQHDLASSTLILLANLTAVSGEIIFNISNGQHTLIEKLTVKVLPVYQAVLEVRQASGKAIITMTQMQTIPKRTTETFIYKITRKPSYGDIVVGHIPVTEFNEEQVNKNELAYTFTSFLSNQDQFEYFVFSDQGEEAVGKITIEVSPMVKIGNKQQWPRGCTIRLGPDVVDASELGKLTKSVPQFRVIHHPREGKVVRFPYEGGRGEATSTNAFSQQELESGFIGVELREDEQTGTGIRGDRLHLVVSASQVPPANVTVRFSTVPFNSSHSYSATLLRKVADLETTTNVATSTTAFASTRIFTTNKQSPTIGSTILLESMTSESSTQLQTTAPFASTTGLTTIKTLDRVSTSAITPALVPTTYPDISKNSTNTVTQDFWVSEDLTTSATHDVFLNTTNVNASTIPNTAREDTLLGFMNTHMYSILLPICIVLLLILLGLLILAYFVRRKKMGKHHVQKAATSAAKTENGAADRQTFRPTEPDSDIPLCDVGGHRGNGVGGNGQPGSQYWV
ncbi:PREDICTED: chondroitin sulfate proteoglycan 4 [Nanorana parkeri]|uniref:chondroitin sulfate proteoglycan 4 n=1 Tax=Nanorana parkeri TaxID=125878 RepID=UPI00085413E0|nr:PREDICTED: chondroitin sulfate proteoglycan 4 [Nanorana parkeri]